MAEYRNFNGKRYQIQGSSQSKGDAARFAKELRRGGLSTRIVVTKVRTRKETSNTYQVYGRIK